MKTPSIVVLTLAAVTLGLSISTAADAGQVASTRTATQETTTPKKTERPALQADGELQQPSFRDRARRQRELRPGLARAFNV